MRVTLLLANPLLRRRDGSPENEVLFARCVRQLCEVAIMSNKAYLAAMKRAGTPVAPLYSSGVVARDEPRGQETCADIPVIASQGWGDCMMLASWRVAELQEKGERAKIRVSWQRLPNNKRLFHVTVRRGNGAVEDPFKLLKERY